MLRTTVMVLMMASLFWAIPEILSASRCTFVRFRDGAGRSSRCAAGYARLAILSAGFPT